MEKQRASIYNVPPKDVIVWMLKVLGKEKDEKPIKVDDREETEKDGAHFFLSNMNKLQDLMQAKMLQDLDKGSTPFMIFFNKICILIWVLLEADIFALPERFMCPKKREIRDKIRDLWADIFRVKRFRRMTVNAFWHYIQKKHS